MHATHELPLVALSILIAVFAAYTALDLANALTFARGRIRHAWLFAGALAMGVGIWSMHLIGMLAYRVPGLLIGYDVLLLIVSVLIAIGASGFALWVITRDRPTAAALIGAGVLMGAAIAGMHYVGIAGMRVDAAMSWRPSLVAASLVIAGAASVLALWFAFHFRREDDRLGLRHRLMGGIVLGGAIAGMHYTAMAALTLQPGAGAALDDSAVIATDGLALAVALAAIVLLSIAVAGSLVGRALGRRTDLALENERLYRLAEQARADAEQRAELERALRSATRELGGAGSTRQVAEILVDSVCRAVATIGVYVEARDLGPVRTKVEVVAATGPRVPPLGTRVPFPGSLTEEILGGHTGNGPVEIDAVGHTMAPYLRGVCADCSALLVPLSAGGVVEGALVLLRAADAPSFSEREAEAAHALAETAAAALRRVGLLEAVRESEERLRQLAENVNEVFWISEIDTHRLLYVSPAYEQVWGHPTRELYEDGHTFLDAVHPEDRARVTEAYAHVADGGYDVDFRIHRADGVTRWIRARAFPVRDGRDEVYRIVGIAEDITRRRETEDAQHFLAAAATALASSLNYRETLNSIAQLAVPHVADWCAVDIMEDGELVRVAVAHADVERQAAAMETGRRYPPDASAETGAGAVFRTGKPLLLRSVADEMLQQVARSPEHLELLRAVGMRSVMMVPLIARGRTLGVITLIAAESGRCYDEEDLNLSLQLATHAALAVDNARLYHEAEQKRTELERVMDSRARLMRGFSHDLKNPLGAADGYAQLLLDGMYGEMPEQQQHAITRMRHTLAAALRLIEDLLELERAESGRLEVKQAPTDIGATITNTADEYRAQALANELSLAVELCDGLPMIITDAHRAGQVLGNLLSNAVKYTPAGGSVAVRVCRENNGASPRPGEWVRIDVSDTGPGIPEDKKGLLFQEFQRLDTRGKKGAGVGLAISRRIAQALGGEITVESEPGSGATFTLWLPVPSAS